MSTSPFGRDRIERPVVVGFGATAVGHHPDRSAAELGFDALEEAAQRAGLGSFSELDGLYLVPEGYTRAQSPMRAQRIGERLGVPMSACVEFENGGTSALLAFKAACQDVATGHLEVAAVVGAQAERRAFGAGDGIDIGAVLAVNAMYGPWLAPYGLVAALSCYALAAQRYMHDHGIAPEAIAELPVRLRGNAALNPRAELREPLSVEAVLGSRLVCPPIHKLEAAPWSDGAAAVVVIPESAARSRGLGGVALTGWGERHDGSSFVPFGRELTLYPWIGEATEQALSRAGRRRDDLDVLEIYGAFAHAELMTYEAMGLFGPGEAPAAVAAGETARAGAFPINPSGGRLSLGHPPQATPLLMVGEIWEQLGAAAGERQVAGAEVGLVQAEHGMMNGAAVAILEAL